MAADEDIISSAIDFWNKLYGAKEAKIRFTKKSDGTIRTMRATLDFAQIPKNKVPKKVNMSKILTLLQKSGIINVYDLDKKDWRSIPFQNVDWVEIGKRHYIIRPYTGRKT